MKKAKIMLAAITILGLASGTLAFKAQKMFGGHLFYEYKVGTQAYCTTGPYSIIGVVPAVGTFFTTTTFNTTGGVIYSTVPLIGVEYCTSTTVAWVNAND